MTQIGISDEVTSESLCKLNESKLLLKYETHLKRNSVTSSFFEFCRINDMEDWRNDVLETVRNYGTTHKDIPGFRTIDKSEFQKLMDAILTEIEESKELLNRLLLDHRYNNVADLI